MIGIKQSACKEIANTSGGKGFSPAILRTVAALAVLDAWEENGQFYGYYLIHQNDSEDMPSEDLHYLVPRHGIPYRPDRLVAERSSGSGDGSAEGPVVHYRRNRPPNYAKRYCYRFPPGMGGWVVSARSNVVLVGTVLRVFTEMAASAPGMGPEARKAMLLEVAGRIASQSDGVAIQPPAIR